MNADAKDVFVDCTHGSEDGRLRFPDVLARLAAVGTERYHADLVRGEKTYYLPDGDSHVVPSGVPGTRAAQAFSATGMEQAVRASQAGAIDYPEFCARAAAAGCVGYLVSLAGRRVVYFGRTGETHVEHFPGSR